MLLLGLLGRTCVALILMSLPAAAALLVAASVFAGGLWEYLGFVGFWVLILCPVPIVMIFRQMRRPDSDGPHFEFGQEAGALVRRALASAGVRPWISRNPRLVIDEGLDVGFPRASCSTRLGLTRGVIVFGLPLLMALSARECECLVVDRALRLRHQWSRAIRWTEGLLLLERRLPQIFGELGHHASIATVLGYRFYRPLLCRFLSWHLPRLAQSAGSLFRAMEASADNRVAELYGAATVETTTAIVAAAEAFLRCEYWPQVVQSVGAGLEAPAPFAGMEAALSEQAANTRGRQAPSAARVLFNERVDKLTRVLDGRWRERNAMDLRALARHRGKAERELEELNAQKVGRELSPEEAWKAAVATERTLGPEAALPLYQALIDDEEVGAKAQFCVGRLLLQAGDDAGLASLRWVAFSRDDELASEAAVEAAGYLLAAGRELETTPFRSRLAELQELLAPVQEERSCVLPRDRFLPHGLSSEVVERIREELTGGPRLWRAFLVQKRVKTRPEQPAYVLGLMTEDGFIHRVNFRHLEEAVKFAHLQVDLPDHCLIVGLYHDEHTKIIRRMRRVRGARIL